jgi:hypothetical protein
MFPEKGECVRENESQSESEGERESWFAVQSATYGADPGCARAMKRISKVPLALGLHGRGT